MPETKDTIVASYSRGKVRVDAGNPAQVWERAQAVSFSTDWQGQNPDPALKTKVRALWFHPSGQPQGVIAPVKP